MKNASSQEDFYTRFEDIEAIGKKFGKHFAGKVVLCNCDDPFESNFFQYFVLNFVKLKLKKLIAISYTPSPIAGSYLPLPDYADITGCRTCCLQINAVDAPLDGDVDRCCQVKKLIDHQQNHLQLLSGNGDFRSYECMKFMNESDIAVTAPPTALLKEYVKMLLDCHKQFLLIGSLQNIQQQLAGFLKQKQIKLLIPPQAQAQAQPRYAGNTLSDTTLPINFLPPHDVGWVTDIDLQK